MAELQEEVIATAFARALDKRDEADGKVRENRKPSQKNAFNPTGGVKPKLARETIFCGAIQHEESLKPSEIELFNQVTPGRYNGDKMNWTVLAADDGMGVTRIDVRVPVSDLNALMDLPNSLVGILNQIVTEAADRSPRAKAK